MLFAALRDMQWRKRRLIIAIVSTALIFGMTLVMTGLTNGFRVEARDTVDSMGVDAFVVKTGAAGPFLGSTPFPGVDLARIAAEPGVVAAAPLACVGTIMKEGTSTRNVTAFGAPERGPGMPRVSQGQAPSRPDEVAASSALGRHIGDSLQVGAHVLRIVGIVPNSTALAKIPNIFLPTKGLQYQRTGELLALPLIPGITHSLGGAVVDRRGQVLDTDNEPISGLYGAGPTGTGPHGAYFGGLATGLIQGMLAAETITASAESGSL
jgi:FAD binding domain